MKIAVVTTFNQRIYDQYANRFVESYNWAFPVNVYSEEPGVKEYVNSSLISSFVKDKLDYMYSFYDIHDRVEGSAEFVERNKGREANGYRFDGVKFSYKVFAYSDFVLRNHEKYDGIICIDADSVFYEPINSKWIKKYIHRDDCMMTFLGRSDKNPKAKGAKGYPSYSECGFLYFNCNHDKTVDYMKEMQRMYLSDDIYKEREYHDSWIWDRVRKRFESEQGVKNHDIGDDKWGHVQARSVLANVYDHTKGDDKKTGISKHRSAFRNIAKSKL